MDANIFDFQDIWQRILERSQKEGSDALEGFAAYLEKMYPNPALEDFAFYKDYLSRFVINEELYGKELLHESSMSYDESILLVKLAAASFSSTYDLDYLPGEDKLELTFYVKSGDKSITKKLQDLWFLQIETLFLIYFEEQLHLEYLLSTGGTPVREERKMRLNIFEKKLGQCLDKLHGHDGGSGSAESLASKLDDLLNS